MEQPNIALRSATPADGPFLRALFLDSRPELRMLPADLLDLQLAAQLAQYRADYPQAQDRVICSAGKPVGRCWTSRSPDELRLLDIAVLGSRRGQGIGHAVMSDLCAQAAADDQPVRLTVWHANTAAHRFYARLGFHDRAERNGYLSMEWR